MSAQNWSTLRDLRVLVQEAAEPVVAGDLHGSVQVWVRQRPERRGLAEGTVRAVLVEVPLVFGQDRDGVTLADDEDPVRQLTPPFPAGWRRRELVVMAGRGGLGVARGVRCGAGAGGGG